MARRTSIEVIFFLCFSVVCLIFLIDNFATSGQLFGQHDHGTSSTASGQSLGGLTQRTHGSLDVTDTTVKTTVNINGYDLNVITVSVTGDNKVMVEGEANADRNKFTGVVKFVKIRYCFIVICFLCIVTFLRSSFV